MKVLLLVAVAGCARGQGPELPVDEQLRQSGPTQCLEPPPLVRWEDYEGPFKKVVGTFARKLEQKSAHSPHYKPGAVLCSLEAKDKFILFVRDTVEPVSFLSAGFNAGLDQAEDRDPTFGQGAAGYGKRLGTNFAGEATWRFFTDFAYPSVFAEDPRYYRLSHGTRKQRLLHAMEHTFIAHRDNGKRMFNYSEWLGTASSSALSNVYHAGDDHGFSPFARQVGFAVLQDMGFDVLREFWPEVARKFRMPFRQAEERNSAGEQH
jgi:hypothetical protein